MYLLNWESRKVTESLSRQFYSNHFLNGVHMAILEFIFSFRSLYHYWFPFWIMLRPDWTGMGKVTCKDAKSEVWTQEMRDSLTWKSDYFSFPGFCALLFSAATKGWSFVLELDSILSLSTDLRSVCGCCLLEMLLGHGQLWAESSSCVGLWYRGNSTWHTSKWCEYHMDNGYLLIFSILWMTFGKHNSWTAL